MIRFLRLFFFGIRQECSWCEPKSRSRVLRKRGLFGPRLVSHGICDEHARQVREQFRNERDVDEVKFARPRILGGGS